MQTTAFHLRMRDGVRIAIELCLPQPIPAGGLTAAIRCTRYWRRSVGAPELIAKMQEDELRRAEAAGFALVLVDARGSGASFGTWAQPWSRAEIEDYGEVVDWIAGQPWSNGSVVGYGTSYDGTAAHLLAATGRSAVKAVAPRFSTYDAYAHIGFPGGVALDWFLRMWDAGNHAMDGRSLPEGVTAMPLLGAVKPVDDDEDGRLLVTARDDHSGNFGLWEAVRGAEYRGDVAGADGILADEVTPMGRVADIEAAGVPLYVWTSWFDGGYAASAIAGMQRQSNLQRVVIGPWAHGAVFGGMGSPYGPDQAPLEPDLDEQWRRIFAFLRHGVAPTDAEMPQQRLLRYYTMGEEAWHETDTWPPENVATSDFYFGPAGSLGSAPPADDQADEYEVDFEATTGTTTRWQTLIGGIPVRYPDRREADERLLSYTSAPLGGDVEVTGAPVVTLWVTSDHEDGAFFAYLEDVAPDGRVTYITEGQLRAVHRRVSRQEAPYPVAGPYHSFCREDALPLTPGEPAELSFALFPTSVLFRRGHRIRVAVAGHDAGNFRRYPAKGQPRIRLHREPGRASRISLPVAR